MTVLGPGTLKIGETGSEIDLSSRVNGATITSSKASKGGSTTKLDGSSVEATTTFEFTLAGDLDLDDEDGAASFFALSQANPGTAQGFEYTPSTSGGTKATGTLIIEPLDFGGDAYGDALTSKFSFAIVGAPSYTYVP